jgi:hypothetical protein
MRSHEIDDSVSREAWETTGELDGADGCVARHEHGHGEAICPRTGQCHCARPIGHPIPVAVQSPRAIVTSRNSSATALPARRFFHP